MNFPSDLLDQADFLANREPRRPKQASLRRAVSTAYHALFHLIVADAANVLAPSIPAALRRVVQRAFQHSQMKSACRDLFQANAASAKNQRTALPANVAATLTFPIEPDLLEVLTTFIYLQEARHIADYDLTISLSRPDVLAQLLRTRAAFAAWSRIRKTPNAAVFMTSLLLRKEWGR